MKPRMKNPAFLVANAMEPIQALAAAALKGPVPRQTLELVHLRAGQINGCSVCVDMHARAMAKSETTERMFTVAAWREAPYFTDAERAALAQLVLNIAMANMFNRINATTRQVAGAVHWDG